ncbi:FAD-dependent oxidoreductase [Paraburkholderia dipogonis]|uniref:FAD-dependent oxidoreductase n=1 Tax=Paraburkholderia dipogonis TaxID=1211383 RepID=UPI0035ED3D32
MLPSDPREAEADAYAHLCRGARRRSTASASRIHERDWGSKRIKWTLTCVSPMPPGFLTTYGEALHPSVGQLIWSGTETADIWAGYMDGAVRSGHKAALQALQAAGARTA